MKPLPHNSLLLNFCRFGGKLIEELTFGIIFSDLISYLGLYLELIIVCGI